MNQLTVLSVFLDKQRANSLITRQRRNVDGSSPASASSLEQACMERVCTYDEARKFFQDSYRTVSPRGFLPARASVY